MAEVYPPIIRPHLLLFLYRPRHGSNLEPLCSSTGEIANKCCRQSRHHSTTTIAKEGQFLTQDKAIALDRLWQKFFADPSQWWDNRFNKRRPRCPDFVHSTSKEALWIDDWFNPSWIEPNLAALERQSRCRVRALYIPDNVLKCGDPRESNVRLAERIDSFSPFGRVRELCGQGLLKEALQAVCLMDKQGVCLSNNIFSCLIHACIDKEDLAAGRGVHSLIRRAGFELNTFLGSQLIQMFSVCGSLLEANKVFVKLPAPNVFAWSAIILANAKLGQAAQAIRLYEQMKLSVVQADGHVFAAVLKAYGSVAALAQGKLLHSHIISNCLKLDVYVGNALVDMYAKCGSLEDSHNVFSKLTKRDVVTWSALITGYAQHGHSWEALQFFHEMQELGIELDNVICAGVLRACSDIAALDQGNLIHAQIIKMGQELDDFIGCTLVNLYICCGKLNDARNVFHKVSKGLSVAMWNALIGGFAAHGRVQEALRIFEKMQDEGIKPDKATFVSLLKVCSAKETLDHCKRIHGQVIEGGFEADPVVGAVLVGIHSKYGSLEDAQRVFDHLMERDVVTWSTMIACYAQLGHGQEALRLFQQMQYEGIQANSTTFICILKACSSILALNQGELIHEVIIKHSGELDVFVGSTLIDMYVKCGSLLNACFVFERLENRDIATWNAIISGCVQLGDFDSALQYFGHMQCQGLKPDGVTFVCVLSACSHVGFVDEGCHHFKFMVMEHGLVPSVDHFNCMVDLFGRAGHLHKAEDLLQAMPFRHNRVGWMSLLSHCRTHEDVELGRRCFHFVVSMNGRLSAGYMLMTSIYAQACMLEDAYQVEVLRKYANAWKKPGRAFVEVNSKAYDFIVGDKEHPLSCEIYAKLNRLHVQMGKKGYMPELLI